MYQQRSRTNGPQLREATGAFGGWNDGTGRGVLPAGVAMQYRLIQAQASRYPLQLKCRTMAFGLRQSQSGGRPRSPRTIPRGLQSVVPAVCRRSSESGVACFIECFIRVRSTAMRFTTLRTIAADIDTGSEEFAGRTTMMWAGRAIPTPYYLTPPTERS